MAGAYPCGHCVELETRRDSTNLEPTLERLVIVSNPTYNAVPLNGIKHNCIISKEGDPILDVTGRNLAKFLEKENSNEGWNVSGYSLGWVGTWYQEGIEVVLHGVADGTFIFSWKGRLDSPTSFSGRQVEFYISRNTDTAGTFAGTQITGSCPAAGEEAVKLGDPAK